MLLKKLSLKTNIYGGDPESIQEQIILDVENAKTTKNTKMRETLLDKALKALQDFEEQEFTIDEAQDLVPEEIETAKKKFHLSLIRDRKERVLIATEIAKMAFEENLIDLSFDSATLAVKSEWNAQKDADLVIA